MCDTRSVAIISWIIICYHLIPHIGTTSSSYLTVASVFVSYSRHIPPFHAFVSYHSIHCFFHSKLFSYFSWNFHWTQNFFICLPFVHSVIDWQDIQFLTLISCSSIASLALSLFVWVRPMIAKPSETQTRVSRAFPLQLILIFVANPILAVSESHFLSAYRSSHCSDGTTLSLCWLTGCAFHAVHGSLSRCWLQFIIQSIVVLLF